MAHLDEVVVEAVEIHLELRRVLDCSEMESVDSVASVDLVVLV